MVQKIKLASGEKSIRFGNGALINFEEQTGKSFLAGFDLTQLGLKEVAILCYCGLQDAAKLENRIDETTLEEVIEELNEPGSNFVVIDLFSKAMPQLFNKQEEPATKKAGKQVAK